MADDHGDLTARLIDELTPLTRAVEERMDLDDHGRTVVVVALTKAILTGARVGIAEALAQAIEHGVDLRIDLHGDDDTLDELIEHIRDN